MKVPNKVLEAVIRIVDRSQVIDSPDHNADLLLVREWATAGKAKREAMKSAPAEVES